MKLKDIIKGKPLTEAKSAKALRADYDKAVKKEQTLSSLLLVNLEKYKAAKAKGDEKAITRHTKIAGQLGKKKKKATTDASAAYKAYEDKISGLHSDAELEIDEARVNEAKAKIEILTAMVDGKDMYSIYVDDERVRVPAEQWPEFKKMVKLEEGLNEANSDGTISPNEDKEMDELLDFVEEKMQEIFYEAEMETKRIGGQFRQPGYKSQVIKLIEKLVQGFERENR